MVLLISNLGRIVEPSSYKPLIENRNESVHPTGSFNRDRPRGPPKIDMGGGSECTAYRVIGPFVGEP